MKLRKLTEHQWRRETQWQFDVYMGTNEAKEEGRQKGGKRRKGNKDLEVQGEVCIIKEKKTGVVARR